MRPRQAGVVLITVLLIAALATVAAVAMLDGTQIAAARGANLRAADQAYLHALALEDRARLVLVRDARGSDHRREAWALPISSATPDALPGALAGDVAFEAAIEDLQARFNLNNLVREGAVSEPDVVYFRRLLAGLGLAPGLADAVVDWIDPDGVPRSAHGAEDGTYLERDPPHLAANRAMHSISELRVIAGFSAEAVARLEPHVTALPEPTPINVNTAGPVVLASLSPGLDARTLEGLLADRHSAAFEHVAQFLAHPVLHEREVASAALAVSSGYFALRAQVQAGRGRLRLHSVLRRGDDGRVGVLTRSRAGD